jgi:hypothetical protein
MDSVSEGLLNGRNLRTNEINISRPEGLRWQLDELGKAAVLRDPDDLIAGTNMRVTQSALVTCPADNVALSGDNISNLVAVLALHSTADIDNLSEQLVAHHTL